MNQRPLAERSALVVRGARRPPRSPSRRRAPRRRAPLAAGVRARRPHGDRARRPGRRSPGRPSTGATQLRGLPRHDAPAAITHARQPAGPHRHDLHRHDGRQRHDLLLRGQGRQRRRRLGRLAQIAEATPRARVVLDRQRDRASRTASRARPPGRRRRDARPTTTASRASPRRSSVNAGGSVDLHVAAPPGRRRTTSRSTAPAGYGGAQGRLISTIRGLTAPDPPRCVGSDSSTTGLIDCSTGRSSTTISRPRATGRPASTCSSSCATTTATHNEILLVVRDDGSHSRRRSTTSRPTPTRRTTLRRQVALHDLSNPAATRSRAPRAPSRSPSTGRTRSRPAAPTRTTGTRAPTSPPSAGSSARATTSTYVASRTSHADGAQARRPRGRSSPAPTTSTGRSAMRDAVDGRARRRHVARLPRRQRHLLERPLRGQPGRRARATACMVALQDDRERPGRPERHPDLHVARPGRPQPARERADRPDVRRRQLGRRLPAARVRRRGQAPHLALHAARRRWPPARPRAIGTGTRRLGVGRARRQRPRARRRGDARRPRRSTATSSRTTARVYVAGLDDARRARSTRPPSGAHGLRHRHEQLVARPGAQRRRRGRARREHPAGDGERARRHGRRARRRPRPALTLDAPGAPAVTSTMPRPARPASHADRRVDGDVRPRARPGDRRRRRPSR